MHFRALLNLEDYDEIDECFDRYAGEPESDEYMEFIDCTDDIKKEYETDKITLITFANGKVVCDADLASKYRLDGGVVYEKVGDSWVTTPKTAAMTVTENYPAKDFFKTYRSYANRYGSYGYDEDYKKYGYMCNPNGVCDWYSHGGRYSCSFLVKKSVKDVLYREFKKEDMPYAPRGYRWVYGAAFADIEWELMKKIKINSGIRNYARCSRMYLSGKVDKYYQIDRKNKMIKAYGELVYRADDTLETYLRRNGYFTDIHYCTGCTYFVDTNYELEDAFYDKHMWQKELDDKLSKCDPDTYLVMLDVHC